ncbi:MAG: hypothetical protein IPN22_03315 [Bacteroidetes bacterium]|nr:hypothetical protein [Bacteroidota bacterium]
MRQVILVALFFMSASLLRAQNLPDIIIEPYSINNMPALQSYAYGKQNGYWILFGGRLDGLHRRQPFASFDAAGNNTNIYVVDPLIGQVWSASTLSLPASLQEQLQSTNMQFHQEDTLLYLVGGYGYSATAADHITYPNLTAVNLKSLSNAVINGTSINASFRQITHPFLAVTGGHLGKLDSTYLLAVGNRFDGRYNPMGNPTYTQTYTNAIRKFEIEDDGVTLSISHLDSMVDALQLHRRDYNMVPQIFNNSTEGYTIFSGVFQTTADLPFLNSVDFTANSYTPNNGFNQYLNHYHCPNFGAYDSLNQQMHSFFFGGISQYYVDNNGLQVQDNNVPFVKTIARITRTANGNMTESKLNIEMPALLGSGAELILTDELPLHKNEVVKMNELSSDTTLIGYIYGGIASTAPNIFTSNTGTQSSASANLYKVYMIQQGTPSGIQINNADVLALKVFPNPTKMVLSDLKAPKNWRAMESCLFKIRWGKF